MPAAGALLLAALAGAVPLDAADARAALLEGVETIASPGVPGPLVACAPNAAVVVAGRSAREAVAPLVVAAPLGEGRVVAFGHGGFLSAGAAAERDTGRLLVNAMRWAAGDAAEPRVGIVGRSDLTAWLESQALAAEELDRTLDEETLAALDVVVVDQGRLSDEQIDTLQGFASRGGGLLVGGLGWGWLQLNPGRRIDEHPSSRLLAPAGVAWADGTLDDTVEEGFDATAPLPATLNAAGALETFLADELPRGPEAEQALDTLVRAARTLPQEDALLLPRLAALQREGAPLPGPDSPLRRNDVRGRLQVTLRTVELLRRPPAEVTADPAAARFPGAVPPDAARVARTLSIDLSTPGWHSTGLYAAPGERVELRAPEDVPGGILLRIGVHTDEIWHHDRWSRPPTIWTAFSLRAGEQVIASPWGGPLLVDVRRPAAGGRLGLELKGAVEAPLYVHGVTTAEDWKVARARPAPWAELVSTKLALSVPSEFVRELDDPAALMDFWDAVLDADADLVGRPRERERPERIVPDVQISAGYMHSGYPIMTHLDWAPRLVDWRGMKAGDPSPWGPFHELGHNHQEGAWTFAGTGEVTCNLFTLYALETVCGLSAEDVGWGGDREQRVREHLAAGAPFERWKSDPALALAMYQQVIAEFGWQPLREVLAGYRALPRGERPRSDDDKRDRWLVRLSRGVGRDLGPFFQAWGVPTSEAARAELNELEPWLPDGFPPR